MSLSRDSKAEKKLKALRRAEFALQQRYQRIDWEEDFLYPEIEALKAGRPVLGLEAGAVFDLQVMHAHQNLGHDSNRPTKAARAKHHPAPRRRR